MPGLLSFLDHDGSSPVWVEIWVKWSVRVMPISGAIPGKPLFLRIFVSKVLGDSFVLW